MFFLLENGECLVNFSHVTHSFLDLSPTILPTLFSKVFIFLCFFSSSILPICEMLDQISKYL